MHTCAHPPPMKFRASAETDRFSLKQSHVKLTSERTKQLRSKIETLFKNIHKEDRPPFAARGRDNNRNNRDALWFGRPNKANMLPVYRTYSVAYGRPDTRAGTRMLTLPEEMHDWMGDLLDEISGQLNLHDLNHVVLHRYIDGADSIGPHHDKYMDFTPGSSIVSISLGETRKFAIHDRKGKMEDQFNVEDGDVVVLPFDINKTKKHSVPPTKQQRGVRYSITARSIDTFVSPDGVEPRILQTRDGPVVLGCADQ